MSLITNQVCHEVMLIGQCHGNTMNEMGTISSVCGPNLNAVINYCLRVCVCVCVCPGWMHDAVTLGCTPFPPTLHGVASPWVGEYFFRR